MSKSALIFLSGALVLLLFTTCNPAFAALIVLRDTIGIDGSLTDGLPGYSTAHDGGTWNTPGMVVDVPETGNLAEVKIVIFARKEDSSPENNLANILGYHMRFHVWSDEIQGGPDSFYDNAFGFNVPGHVSAVVNSQAASFISAQAFGLTGPPSNPTMFTTFLITMDLSSFDIELQGGQQYVVGVTDEEDNFVTGGGFYRQIGSRSITLGIEDLFQQNSTPANKLPGFIDSQLGFGVEQHAGAVTMSVPLFGDYNDNGILDAADYSAWRDAVTAGASVLLNDPTPGTVDETDFLYWRDHFGETLGSGAGSASSAAVPEPTAYLLALGGWTGLLYWGSNCRRKMA